MGNASSDGWAEFGVAEERHGASDDVPLGVNGEVL